MSPKVSGSNTDDGLIEAHGQHIRQGKAEILNTTHSQAPVKTIASFYNIDIPNQPSIIDIAAFK